MVPLDMTRARRVLARVAAVWLCCQLVAGTLGPVAIALGAPDANAVECTCGHGGDATCPMHHKSTTGSKVCVMRALGERPGLVLSSTFGLTGPVPASTYSIVLASDRREIWTAVSMRPIRPAPPDPPPPRA